VTAQVFRRRLERDVCPERERPLERGGRERVVHDGDRPRRFASAIARGKIDDLEQGIRRRLEPHDTRGLLERTRESAQVAHVDDVGDDPPLREEVVRATRKP
jgi:hypothetical protein